MTLSSLTRRRFLGSLAAAGLAGFGPGPAARSADATRRLGFSTLGCPAWSWRTILDFAVEHGFAAIELRGLEAEMDLTRVAVFSPARLAVTRRELVNEGLRVSCLGSSASMHHMDPAVRQEQLDEGRRFVDLAAALEAPYVRVFGDRFLPEVSRDAMIEHVAAGLRELGEYARPRGVMVLIESHGDFVDSASLKAVLTRADSSAVALLWDAHHTIVSGGERPADTLWALGAWMRHTHLKDSRPEGDGRRYVLTGQGDVPVGEQIQLLARAGYEGYYSFEWEKRWHPDLEEPEVALPHFARVAREYLEGVSRQ